MATSGEEIDVKLTFERPLTNEKLRKRCAEIAEHLEDEDDD